MKGIKQLGLRGLRVRRREESHQVLADASKASTSPSSPTPMSPRSKRARTTSPATGEYDELVHEDATSKLEPHEMLWHEDGNIVLATDAYLYRVHRGILANQSTVFKDMFQLPDIGEGEAKGVGESVVENWNGVPLVKMDDKDEDVYNFLMALYDRK